MSRKFNHLHVHSSFSLLDGVSKREDLIQKAKQFGMDALAMTEHGNIFNAISFYKECTDASVKPIIGQEFYVAPDNHLNRTYSKKSESEQEAKLGDLTYYAYHLTVLAKNRDGYESLKKLSSMAWKNGFYKKPRIDDELLAENKNGLIVLSGCLAGKIAKLIVAGNKDKALDEINKQRSMFGEDFYLELMSHGISEDAVVNECLIDISKQYGIPLVLTGDSHFTEHGDEFSHEVALAIGTNKTIQDPDRFKFNGEGYWLKSGDEMEEVATAASIPMEALENTINISNRVDDYGFKLTSRKHKSIIPLFRDEHGEAYTNEVCHSLLEAKAWSGLVERGVGENEEYHKRLVVELELIKKKEFSSYFLIIADIVDFMRVKKMPIPVGRGSSLGSLLCYCLFITGLDPIQYTIPFSRFINEGRKDLPDIDTDISQERRKEVIEYIVNKYGKDRVAQIATFQSMAAKAAVDNVGRALGVPSTIRRSVGHLIGDTVKDDKVKDIIESNSKVRAIMEQTPEWIRVTERLEGNHRNMGAHAAGIVISNDPIMNHLPLVKDSTEGYLTTQYDMKDISELGLLKLDMLGLKTLDVIYQTLDLIKVRHNIELDFHKFPVNDAATYQTISNGKFVSMFQCDSSGMRSVAKQLQPEIFDHLIALNALYRPGPMLKVNGELSIMEHYIERRHNREEVDLWHPAFETVFKGTYGLPLYQEQVMAISQIIGRFNDTEADEYRAAIGKKDKVKFQAVQDKLVKRGIENGHTPEWMADLTAKLAGSARYNWNKGHCKLPTTPILTCDRGWTLLKDLKLGEKIWSVREKTGQLFRNRIVDIINNGVKPICKVTTAGGNTTFSTLDHRYMTAKQTYVHASEMFAGQSLKMAKQRISKTDLDGRMAFPAHSNEIPFRVGINNISGNDMMQLQPITAKTKHALASVPVQQGHSEFVINLMAQTSSSRDLTGIATPDVLKDRPGIHKDPTFLKSFTNSILALKTSSHNRVNLSFDKWRDSQNTLSDHAHFLNVSRERGSGGLERQHTGDRFATMPIKEEFFDQRFIDVVGVSQSTAVNTSINRFPLPNTNGDAAINANSIFGVVSTDTINTESTDDVGLSLKDLGTFSTQHINDINHDEMVNSWNIPVTYTDTVQSVEPYGEAEVWDLTMEEDPNFIANGFVVHNSLAYSYISYVTAYLETHFALEYYTTLLNVNLGDADQLKVLLSAILQKGIKLLPPHINHSGEYFHTDGTVIYMGLYSVKQVGETTLPAIMDDRKKYGPYNGYIDFCIRMSPHGRVTKLHKENLAKAGAFSWDTSITDKEKVVNTELIQKIVKKFEGKVPPDEVYKYVIDKIVLNQEEYSASEKLSLERSVLNFYISSHPVMQYQPLFNLFPDVNFITPSQINEQMVGTKAIVLGVAEQRLMKQTKNGDPFMVLKLGDQLGNHQINIWSPLAQKAYAKTADDQVVLVCGTIREDKFRPGDNQLNVFSVVPVHSLGGLPITSFYSDDISVANRICTTLNAVPATVSDVVLNLGHAVILKDTSYIKPEHYLELSQYRVHYQLAI